MLDDILEIPGNRAVYNALIEHLSKDKAIAFAGAGCSAGLYPLWGELIDQLADFAVQQGKAEQSDAERWKRDRTSTAQQRVRNILRKLDEPLYFQFLRQTFKERRGPDGKRFTPIHAALLRLPFRGYVTTNYDPALDFARAEIRPACLTTGIPTWQDDDDVYGWLTGDVFTAPDACPILWLHGSWQRPSSIVLNSGEYAAAYKPGIYRNTFRRLWEQDHLVFAGFGFNDPQFTFMIGEILREIAGAHPVPRHIAILGLRSDSDGQYPGKDAIAEQRAGLEQDYHVRPLFYRVRSNENHEELLELLDVPATAVAPLPSPPPVTTISISALVAHWRHETTDDARFTGREEEQERLDRWVRDEAVRVIGVAAVGGTGKTALVAHWLKETEGWKSRPFAGLFAWSFYRERDSTIFLREFLIWAQKNLGIVFHGPGTAVSAVIALLRDLPLVLVLDGLEVLQEGPDRPRYGAFLDGTLRELLVALCSRKHQGLAVLTSRFLFADLEQFAGTSFHQLDLSGLTPAQGASLLADLEVRGSESDRAAVSDQLEGHPLGLRVFAEAIPAVKRDAPLAFVDMTFTTAGLTNESALTAKVGRLLSFYEQKLSPDQVRLLSVVALYRAPVTADSIIRLMYGLYGEASLPNDAVLTLQLSQLHARGVLTRDPISDGHYGYACHPILRDHFRNVLLGTSGRTAQRAADLLAGPPSDDYPESAQELEPFLLAIELLLDAGEVTEAFDVIQHRLNYGEVFWRIPAIAEGVHAMTRFLRDEERRQLVERALTPNRFAWLLHCTGLLAVEHGSFTDAVDLLAESAAISERLGELVERDKSVRIQLDGTIAMGHLAEAIDSATRCVANAERLVNLDDIILSWARKSRALALSAQTLLAAESFAIANAFENHNGRELIGGCGTWFANFLLRTGWLALANQRTLRNLAYCERSGWNHHRARCHCVLSECAFAEGRMVDAKEHLHKAEEIFHRGQILTELAGLHVVGGRIALAGNDQDAALARAAEALAIAQPRRMRLVHADALVLRGRARLITDPIRALDDAEEALRIARDTGYALAERDALELKTAALVAIAPARDEQTGARYRADADRTRAEAAALSARLRLTAEDLRQAEVKAAAWVEAWDKRKSAASDN